MYSTPVFLPAKSQGQRRLVDYSPWVCKGSETIENACISIFKKILNIVNIIFWYLVHSQVLNLSLCFSLIQILIVGKKKEQKWGLQNLLLRLFVGFNKITYVQVPKAVFGMLEDSLNASSLALSPQLCVLEKKQKRQAQWNTFLEPSLKQS